MRKKITLFSAIMTIIGVAIVIASSVISDIPYNILISGVVSFLLGACLMAATTGSKNNISIIFSCLTIFGVVITTILFVLALCNVIQIRSSFLWGMSGTTKLFYTVLGCTVGSAVCTYLTSTTGDNHIIKILRNLVAGIAVVIAIIMLITSFTDQATKTLTTITSIIEVLALVSALFLLVLDKQEALETVTVLESKCKELQEQTTKAEEQLQNHTTNQENQTKELEQLRKKNEELAANAQYYTNLYQQIQQEAIYQQTYQQPPQPAPAQQPIYQPEPQQPQQIQQPVYQEPIQTPITNQSTPPTTSPIPQINLGNNN